ncbi:MAG TPA: exodeoxyribonuclease VII large subunit [Gemmatimonadota bacterium]|nr:exodeoxyribonuclease VII large subunit [Gemmatimonadota bacterium]
MSVRGMDPGFDTSAAAPVTVMTVSELVMRASGTLEAEFGTVAVEGEISSYSWVQRSGHMYWTLKDAASQVECAMFRSDNLRLRFRVADGERVVVIGRPTIYRIRGRFQIVVSDVLPQGRGALWLRFEELKRKLAAEGLFDEDRKRALPFWPRAVAVVTSSDGAALRDICTVIERRSPATRVLLKAVPVQGREAAPEIARAVRWFAQNRVAEVLIVGRGGGSLEDLWAFNEEIVVRAIAESPIPVVSAVGHETDTTLADFAADLRAPTPSAAAEHVVPETREIARSVVGCFRRLSRAVERQRLRRVEEALAPIKRYGFRRVRDRLREARQRWGEGVDSLAPSVRARSDDARLRLSSAREWLPEGPKGRRADTERRLEVARALPRELARRNERVRTRYEHAVERLQAASPLAILDRGYAVVTGPGGAVLREAAGVEVGDRLRVRLAGGGLGAQVTDIETDTEEGR